MDLEYEPNVTVIIPTYNEAELIEGRLENLKMQTYPMKRIEILVVDSGSTDGTAEIVREWSSRNSSVKITILEESVRRGMNPALNYALSHLTNNVDIGVFTDADCEWKPDALTKAVMYLSAPTVGAVTCCIGPNRNNSNLFESKYRGFNNLVRVAESKLWSTPIAHGPFFAFKRYIMEEIGGVPKWTGANDSAPASVMAFMGYRCLATPEVVVSEYVPTSLRDNVSRRIRRGQHLIQHFKDTGNNVENMLLYSNKKFKKVFNIEKFLHLINPWLLILSASLLLLDLTINLVVNPSLMLFVFTIFLSIVSSSFRTWILTQLILIYASIKNLFTKDLIWEPIIRTAID